MSTILVPAALPAVSLNGASKSSARILVVDDQMPNIQVVGGILGKFGYEIIPASNGPTALKRLALRPPDLILLDVLMPGMDGLEVCRRIRDMAEWRDIPIIFFSAADDKELIVRALEAGGVDYVTKPFNHAEMVMRVRTHLALKEARDKAKQLAEDKDELLDILAHDLKNHLGGIEMSANLLRDFAINSQNKKAPQLCENIRHSTAHLLAFVKEFLANSAADHGINLKSQVFDICDSIKSAVNDYHEAAVRKKIEIVTDLPFEAIEVLADRNALDQVLDNLISNAVKFSAENKTITILVNSVAGRVECVVQDQGPGFTAEDKKRMFRRYGRLSAKPTGGEPSTGLGLSIVKRLVNAMNGELVCDSSPGNGATFIVRLPQPIL
jgi:two-component system sensor histidine kinase/response regulator